MLTVAQTFQTLCFLAIYWLSPPNAEQGIRVQQPLIPCEFTASDARQLELCANFTRSLRMCKNEKIICFYRHCAVHICPQVQHFPIHFNYDQGGKHHKQVLVTAEAIRQIKHTSKDDFIPIICSNRTQGKKKGNINTIISNKVFQICL